jgi:hypothetical protein
MAICQITLVSFQSNNRNRKLDKKLKKATKHLQSKELTFEDWNKYFFYLSQACKRENVCLNLVFNLAFSSSVLKPIKVVITTSSNERWFSLICIEEIEKIMSLQKKKIQSDETISDKKQRLSIIEKDLKAIQESIWNSGLENTTKSGFTIIREKIERGQHIEPQNDIEKEFIHKATIGSLREVLSWV